MGGPRGARDGRRGLIDEALRLAEVLVELLPHEPEPLGLLALPLPTQARTAAPDDDGAFVPLDRQDVALWSGRTRPCVAICWRRPVRTARDGRP